jgi:hypothetical protein
MKDVSTLLCESPFTSASDISENECLGIYNIQFASPGGGWVVAHRDFCILGLIKKLDDGCVMLTLFMI